LSSLEFPLAQGWTNGLVVKFYDRFDSKNILNANDKILKQVHGDKIIELEAKYFSGPQCVSEGDGFLCDAELLKSSQSKLIIQTADCLPIFFIEKEQKKICAVHAGWRGILKNIHLLAFEKFDFQPKNTWIWIGPSLNGKEFEVAEDMYSQFPKHITQDTECFIPHEDLQKRYFSPWNLLDKQFRKLGVELVYNTFVNTKTTLDFASYRRGDKSERNLSGIFFT